jgi:hypothetical protein
MSRDVDLFWVTGVRADIDVALITEYVSTLGVAIFAGNVAATMAIRGAIGCDSEIGVCVDITHLSSFNFPVFSRVLDDAERINPEIWNA